MVWLADVVLPMGFQSPSTSSLTRVPELSLMVGSQHPHLLGQVLGEPPKEQPYQFPVSKRLLATVTVLALVSQTGWMPRWGNPWMALLSVSAPFFLTLF